MIIETIHKTLFVLNGDPTGSAASLLYQDTDFRQAQVTLDKVYTILPGGTGEWITRNENVKVAHLKVEPGTRISLRLECRKKKYHFKKSSGWKLRFSLCNRDGDELLTLLPAVNWLKESHDYVLQLNEEYEEECDSFLILQAVHCANLSLSMMTGGKVPALISI